MADVTFKMNTAGIREISKSAEMRAALAGEAAHLANKANLDAFNHGYKGKLDAYAYGVTNLRGTAVGWVSTGSNEASIKNENAYKSLSNLNH